MSSSTFPFLPLQILQLGNPILRQKATEVASCDFSNVADMAHQMIILCQTLGGYGMAAPQIGHSSRYFVMMSQPSTRYPKAPFLEPLVLINPIIHHTDNPQEGWEGCLSIPNLYGRVVRYKTVVVSFTNAAGTREKRTFYDMLARIVQHEVDHLDGVMFIDHAPVWSLVMLPEYEKIRAAELAGEALVAVAAPVTSGRPDVATVAAMRT